MRQNEKNIFEYMYMKSIFHKKVLILIKHKSKQKQVSVYIVHNIRDITSNNSVNYI